MVPYCGRQVIHDEVLLRQRKLTITNSLASPGGIVTFALELGSTIGEFLSLAPPVPKKPTGKNYGEVERLYRNLKVNYISQGDNKNAGDFHYGEMEMHRRAIRWEWFFNWYNLYRFLSGYGERPTRALGWLILFFLITSGLVYWLGLEIWNTHRLASFQDSFIFILQKVTLQRPTWADPICFWGKIVAGLSVLLIPGQATLFLLALRNRLGRPR